MTLVLMWTWHTQSDLFAKIFQKRTGTIEFPSGEASFACNTKTWFRYKACRSHTFGSLYPESPNQQSSKLANSGNLVPKKQLFQSVSFCIKPGKATCSSCLLISHMVRRKLSPQFNIYIKAQWRLVEATSASAQLGASYTLSWSDLTMVIHSPVTSLLDCCYALYVGLLLERVRKHQWVQKVMTRLLAGAGFRDHITSQR